MAVKLSSVPSPLRMIRSNFMTENEKILELAIVELAKAVESGQWQGVTNQITEILKDLYIEDELDPRDHEVDFELPT